MARRLDPRLGAGEDAPIQMQEATPTINCKRQDPHARDASGGSGRGVWVLLVSGSHLARPARRQMYSRLSVPAQGSRQLKKFGAIQIGYYPIRHLRPVPVKDLVALRILLPNGEIGRAMIWPDEHIDVVHSALVDKHGDRPRIHIIQPAAD